MKNVLRTLPLVLVLTFATTGCFKYGVATPVASDGVLRMQRGPVFAWGLAGRVREAPECPAGVASTRSYMPWWGGLVTGITVGIVAPWRVEYVCARGAATASTPAPAPAQ